MEETAFSKGKLDFRDLLSQNSKSKVAIKD